MKNYFALLILVLLTNCSSHSDGRKGEVNETSSTQFHLTSVTQQNPQGEPLDSDPYTFQNFEEYDLTDTIEVDISGDGLNEKIYFTKDSCKQIIIERLNQKNISIGCNETKYLDYPELVDWVNFWGVVKVKKTWEVLFTATGDLEKDTVVQLEHPSIYIGKREVGGGIITFKEDKVRWVHQSD